jgi:hypothetical protein
MGRLEAIWTKRAHRGPMDARLTAYAAPGKGLEGCAGNSRIRQITLIEQEVWNELMRETGGNAPPSARRANLMVSGMPLLHSRNRLLRIGPVVLRIAGGTTPCEAMEGVLPGLQKAMSPDWRGGVFAQVLTGGALTVGDPTEWAGRVVAKVMACVTRNERGVTEILVARRTSFHAVAPEVPSGNVLMKESLADALQRVLQKQTGRRDLTSARPLTRTFVHVEELNQWQERNIFRVEAPLSLPDTWEHVTQDDDGIPEHFGFSWAPVSEAESVLGPGHSDCINLL